MKVQVVFTTPNGVFNYKEKMDSDDSLCELLQALTDKEEHSMFFEGKEPYRYVITSRVPDFDGEFYVVEDGDDDIDSIELKDFKKPIHITLAFEFVPEVRMLSGATFHTCVATIFHKVEYIKEWIEFEKNIPAHQQ
eukprot:3827839-Amphidinium_carterae.1